VGKYVKNVSISSGNTRHLKSPEFGYEQKLKKGHVGSSRTTPSPTANVANKQVSPTTVSSKAPSRKIAEDEFMTMDELNVLDQQNMKKKKTNKDMLEEKFKNW
jgi:hypothetical protein